MSIQSLENKIKNSAILERFDTLTSQGAAPTLKIYRRDSLIITSYHREGVLGSLVNLVKHIAYRVFSLIGLIHSDAAQIKALTEEARTFQTDYSILRTGVENLPAFQELQKQFTEKTEELDRLKSELDKTRHTIAKLKTSSSQVEDLDFSAKIKQFKTKLTAIEIFALQNASILNQETFLNPLLEILRSEVPASK